jgi:hypothetical protein
MPGGTFAASTAGLQIEIDPGNTVFGFFGDFLVNLEENSVVRYLGTEEEVTIPKQFSGVAAGCFCCLKSVSAVRFEADSRISFSRPRAFHGSSGLRSFSVPSTVEEIPDECFYLCQDLREVTFAPVSRVSVLGDLAFAVCWSLVSMCIPASVTRIGRQCFHPCASLMTITVESGIRVSFIGEAAFPNASTGAASSRSAWFNRLNLNTHPATSSMTIKFRVQTDVVT